MIKTVILKTGYVESNSLGYLIMSHHRGFPNKEDALRDIGEGILEYIADTNRRYGPGTLLDWKEIPSDRDGVADIVRRMLRSDNDTGGEILEFLYEQRSWEFWDNPLEINLATAIYIREYGDYEIAATVTEETED